jgi:Transglutaminase elicitor
MGASFVALAITLSMSVGQSSDSIKKVEIDYQNEVFLRWWETDLTWTFADLPSDGMVPDYRIPYTGHDYPDRAGGTIDVLRKYDRAFRPGERVRIERNNNDEPNPDDRPRRLFGRNASRERRLAFKPPVRSGGAATAFEYNDTTAFTEPTTERGGLFGLIQVTRERTPQWHGHCNGWTSAAIRHAEPQTSVTRNGVVFTPADIKGLLAEIYMYRDNEFLGGEDDAMNPGLLHVVLANWIGRGDHPVGIETAVGKEKWNYPLYAFKTSSTKVSDNEIEVRMNAAYSQSSRREVNHSQHLKKTIHFHYSLALNDEGEIIGGSYYNDSARLDMLWTPLHPVQGGKEGNTRGNPHIDVNEVLSIWRESVPKDLRDKWWNIDPSDGDAIDDEVETVGTDEADLPATDEQPTETADEEEQLATATASE